MQAVEVGGGGSSENPSMNPTEKDTISSRLLALPRELRDIVLAHAIGPGVRRPDYTHVGSAKKEIIITYGTRMRPVSLRSFDLAALFVNKQLHAEGCYVFAKALSTYPRFVLRLRLHEGADFLSSLSPQILRSISSLWLPAWFAGSMTAAFDRNGSLQSANTYLVELKYEPFLHLIEGPLSHLSSLALNCDELPGFWPYTMIFDHVAQLLLDGNIQELRLYATSQDPHPHHWSGRLHMRASASVWTYAPCRVYRYSGIYEIYPSEGNAVRSFLMTEQQTLSPLIQPNLEGGFDKPIHKTYPDTITQNGISDPSASRWICSYILCPDDQSSTSPGSRQPVPPEDLYDRFAV